MHIRCPICKTELDVADDFPSRPFCSARCKLLDLGNWLDEKYRLPRPIVPEDLDELPERLRAELGLSEEELLERLVSGVSRSPRGPRSSD